MGDSQTQSQLFCQRLISIVRELAPNQSLPTSTSSVRQLATLTKLVEQHQEFVHTLKVDHPLTVVVLEGTKHVYWGDQHRSFEAGSVLVIPAHLSLGMVNEPDPKSGDYSALVLELSVTLLERLQHAYPGLINSVLHGELPRRASTPIDLHVPLSRDLIEAIVHLVNGLVHSADDIHGDAHLIEHLIEHRIMEVALLLLKSDRADYVLGTIHPDPLTRVRQLIHLDPSTPWSATRLANELGISVSTLQRRLRASSVSLRQILEEERMTRAMLLLQEGQRSVAQVALACGYESQARFANRFRKRFSLNPSEVRSPARIASS